MNNLTTISTVLPNKNKINYNVILTFKSNISNKNYVVYTDNTYDQNKKLRFYAGIYNPANANAYLGEPATNEEWNEITNVIDSVIPQN